MQTTNNIDKINIFKYLNFEKMKKNGRNPPNKINVIYNNSIIYIYLFNFIIYYYIKKFIFFNNNIKF